MDFDIAKPHDAVFKNYSFRSSDFVRTAQENQWVPLIVKIAYPRRGGILTYHKKHLFPRKGFPYPQAMSAVNVAKRLMMGYVHTFASRDFLPMAAVFAFYPTKKKIRTIERFLEGFNRTVDWILDPHYLHKMFYTDCSREIRQILFLTLHGLGISKRVASKTAEIFAALIEYDDQYRYRIEDICTELDEAALLADPRKELARIEAIFNRREHQVEYKFAPFFKALRYGLFIPKVREAFLRAIRLSDISKLKLDEIDSYQILARGGYDYRGKTLEQRKQEYFTLYNGNIPPVYQLKIIRSNDDETT